MFTGSVTENRITVGLPPYIRQALYDDAYASGQRMPEYLRHILTEWYDHWRTSREMTRGKR